MNFVGSKTNKNAISVKFVGSKANTFIDKYGMNVSPYASQRVSACSEVPRTTLPG